jgi:hypothetical protein
MFNHFYSLAPADIPTFTSPSFQSLKARHVRPETERERLVRLAQQHLDNEVAKLKPRYLKCA